MARGRERLVLMTRDRGCWNGVARMRGHRSGRDAVAR
jgi:hypothetical protein